MRRCSFSEIPESLDVFNSEATSNSNFNGLSSLGGNWLSACEGDALTDLEVPTDLSVDGGSVTICSPVDRKDTFAASGAGHSQLCHFLKHTVHCAYQKFAIEKFIM